MPPSERPLLARQRSEDSSRQAEEEDALLTGQPTNKTQNRNRKWLEIGALSWASIATVAMIIFAVLFSREKEVAERAKTARCKPHKKVEGKRNLVFMVSDGMGPTSLELTRAFRQYTQNLPWNDTLTLDKHLIGSSRTRSSSSLITDSAAGATAFSCGFKSYNGAISVLPDHTPCGTVLEAAKRAGYMTGLVVTTRITDATPACFGSHVQTRAYEDLIAEQLIGEHPLGRMVDIMIGGGRCHFLPNTTEGSCRADDKDLVARAKENGWHYLDSKKELDNLGSNGGVKLPLLALVANSDIPYEINRRHIKDQYPSQYEMAQIALNALKAATADKEKGFFIMIEGSRIDHAGHTNDPAAQVHEVLMHDKTFNSVLKFLEEDETQGVLISTSDHETGGLAAARQLGDAYPSYIWYPAVLANATYSASHLAQQWISYLHSSAGRDANEDELYAFITRITTSGLGFEPTADEIESLIKVGDGLTSLVKPITIFSDAISRRAQVGWSTHGHSAVDVNIYGSDPHVLSKIVGNHENIEVGQFMAEYLDVDVGAVTEELKKKGIKIQPGSANVDGEEWEYAWTGPIVSQDEAALKEVHTGSWL